MRVEKIRETYDVDIQTVHFPLHPDTPIEGKSLAELFAGRGVDLDAMYQRMKGLMDAEGLNVRRVSWTGSYNDSAAWAPDGSKLAYASRIDGRFDVLVLDLTDNRARRR